MMKHTLRLFASAGALATAACSTPPMPQLAPTDIPAQWQQPVASAAWPQKDWWQTFNSPALTTLIAGAETANFDIAAATARLHQAEARAKQASASLFPSLNLNGSADHQIGVAGGTTAHDSTAGVTLGASYELDLAGKNRAARDSAAALVIAGAADRQAVALTTMGNIADTYFLLLSLRERLNLARANLKSAEDFGDLVKQRVDQGFVAAVDLAQQRTVMAAETALIAQLAQQELETRNLLAVMEGVPPEGFTLADGVLSAIAAPAPAPGLPSELLLRRPDIVAAEANLKSAHADLAAARAAFFPAISLTGTAGYQSPALAGAVTTLPGSGGIFGIAAQLVQTIFDAGKLTAKSDEARYREQELLATYRKSVVSAFADVENALGAIAHLAEQEKAQADFVEQSSLVFDVAKERYNQGSADYFASLDAQRALYAARDQLSQTRLARLQAIVALYKALGGGWDARQETQAAPNKN